MCLMFPIPDRVIQAPFAVMAAGAWSGAIDVTIHGQPYPLPRSLSDERPSARLSAPSRISGRHRAPRSHLRSAARGRVHHRGSSTEDAGFDRTIDAQIVSDVAARAGALVPALLSLQPESARIGFRPATDFDAPRIGRVTLNSAASRLWLAYGHYRNGVLLAPATSHQVCREKRRR